MIEEVVVLRTWNHLLEGVDYVPMPDALSGLFDGRWSLTRCCDLPVLCQASLPSRGQIWGLHHITFLASKPVMSTRHNEHTWAQTASSPTAPTRGRELHGKEKMWAKNSWEPRSDKPRSGQRRCLPPVDRTSVRISSRSDASKQETALRRKTVGDRRALAQDLKDNT
jgi:hypothetical protein